MIHLGSMQAQAQTLSISKSSVQCLTTKESIVLESQTEVTSPQYVTKVNGYPPMREYQRHTGRVFGVGDIFDPSNTDEARKNRLMTLAFSIDNSEPKNPKYNGELQLYSNFKLVPLYPETDNTVGTPTNRFKHVYTNNVDAQNITINGQSLEEYIEEVVRNME